MENKAATLCISLLVNEKCSLSESRAIPDRLRKHAEARGARDGALFPLADVLLTRNF